MSVFTKFLLKAAVCSPNAKEPVTINTGSKQISLPKVKCSWNENDNGLKLYLSSVVYKKKKKTLGTLWFCNVWTCSQWLSYIYPTSPNRKHLNLELELLLKYKSRQSLTACWSARINYRFQQVLLKIRDCFKFKHYLFPEGLFCLDENELGNLKDADKPDAKVR